MRISFSKALPLIDQMNSAADHAERAATLLCAPKGVLIEHYTEFHRSLATRQFDLGLTYLDNVKNCDMAVRDKRGCLPNDLADSEAFMRMVLANAAEPYFARIAAKEKQA